MSRPSSRAAPPSATGSRQTGQGTEEGASEGKLLSKTRSKHAWQKEWPQGVSTACHGSSRHSGHTGSSFSISAVSRCWRSPRCRVPNGCLGRSPSVPVA
eukprot:scaffold83189_cov53-Phaeocystis_antarctica.AAC.1